MTFPAGSDIDTYAITAEFFHAYQEQFLAGKLADIQQDVAHNHVGGSNMEFEEKAMNMLATMLGLAPTVIFEPTQKLWEWCDQFINNHSNFDNIILSDSELEGWFEALEEFRLYYEYHPDQSGPLYDKPIDYNLLPYTLLNLLKKSNCNPADI